MSCQRHRVTSGQSNSGHKQMHISKLFSYIYNPFVKSVHKTNHFANIKQEEEEEEEEESEFPSSDLRDRYNQISTSFRLFSYHPGI